MVTVAGWFDAPRCEDEGEEPVEPTERELWDNLAPAAQRVRKKPPED